VKTAEEWIDMMDKSDNGYFTVNFANHIRQVQLDAMKEGVRRAAKVITPDGNYNRIKRQEEGVQAILTAAEQLTEKDLQ
jgi:microcompartment protein CcmL/EutN